MRERTCAPRFWGGSGESAPLQTSTSIRLSVLFFPADESTCSLVVWACVVPASVMQHEVLLDRDSWMRFNNRTYRFLPPRAMDHRMFGEIVLSHHAQAGVRAYAVNSVASDGDFHLCYDGVVGVTLSDEPKLLAVNLVRSNGSQALTGHYLVDMLPQSDLSSEEEHFVASGRHVVPWATGRSPPWGVEPRAWRPPRCRPRPARERSVGRPTASRPAFRPFL